MTKTISEIKCIAGDQVNKFISSVAFSPYIYTQKSSPHPTEGR